MKWTIKTRLLAGCGLLVVVLTAACIIGWRQAASSENRIGAVIKDNQADTAKLERAEGAVQDLLHARRAEKEFLLRKDLAFAQIVTNKIAAVKERFLILSAQPDATSDRTALTNALASVDAFHSAFANLSDLLIRRGLTQDEGLEGELRKAVHAVESTVTNQGIADLDVILLKCRRHEKDYLLRGNTNYLSDIAKRIDEFLTQMTLLSLPEASKTNVMARWKDYYGKMREIMDIDQRVLAASGDCQRDSDALQKDVDTVRSATVAAITEEQKRALSMLSSGKFLMLVLLFVGVVLGAVVAALLTRSITRPVNAAVSVLQSATEQTAAAAAQISSASQTLAEGASEQAASLEETSASLEEMSSMTRRNAENAQQANTLASQTRAAADTGAKDMAEMTRAMQDIKSSSDDIAKIIKTIDEIAFQTNILALNAAVEAARAGEAGMGFAVVADEVRNLAQRSAQAAKETAAKIEGAIAKTSHGVTISSKVAANLTEIVDKARQVDTLAAEVATASREQSQGIAQVNTAVSQMDKVTQTNAASAEESASAAEELNGQAAALKHAVDDLLRLVGQEAHEAPGSSPAAATTPRQVAANRLSSHSKSTRPAVSAPPATAGKASSNGVARTGTPAAEAVFKDF